MTEPFTIVRGGLVAAGRGAGLDIAAADILVAGDAISEIGPPGFEAPPGVASTLRHIHLVDALGVLMRGERRLGRRQLHEDILPAVLTQERAGRTGRRSGALSAIRGGDR